MLLITCLLVLIFVHYPAASEPSSREERNNGRPPPPLPPPRFTNNSGVWRWQEPMEPTEPTEPLDPMVEPSTQRRPGKDSLPQTPDSTNEKRLYDQLRHQYRDQTQQYPLLLRPDLLAGEEGNLPAVLLQAPRRAPKSGCCLVAWCATVDWCVDESRKNASVTYY